MRSTEEEVGEKLENILASGGDLPKRAKEDLEQRIEEYKRLIGRMARKYVRNRVEYEDLIQEAIIGLILADRNYDPKRSEDFHTYAIYRMKGKMYEYCIGNESPIYVPTHIAKAGAYVKQMLKLIESDQNLELHQITFHEIILEEDHEAEDFLSRDTRVSLKELKRKLGRIAFNSKMTYERLARMALSSLSFIVSEEALSATATEEGDVDDFVADKEIANKIREIIGEKRYTVLYMRAIGCEYIEIADRLFQMGHSNNKGQKITRQAVKSIYDETVDRVRKLRVFKEVEERFEGKEE